MVKKVGNFLMVLCIPIAVYCIFAILQPSRFGGSSSIFILLQQALLPSVTACGFYFTITMGLFDFSIGANIILSAIIATKLFAVAGYPGFILGGMLVGILIGTINGMIYIKFKIPSIIVSIGLLMIYECLGMFISGGGILTLDASARLFGKMPYNLIFSTFAFLLAYFFISSTRIGTYIQAIGNNERIVQTMGININRYKLTGFILCGWFAGISSILTVSYSSSVAPMLDMQSMDRNFLPLMGCFVAMALKKYVHPVIAIIVGEITISMLISGLMTNGIDATLQNVIIGLTLLLIVAFSSRPLAKLKNQEVVVK